MELDGLIDAEWGQSENKRRAKYYRLTTRGLKALDEETAHWQQLARAIARVMETA
jgi:DNA-binding PadR family transcriptional regulator